MRADELEGFRVDRGPDRVPRLRPAAGPPGASSTSMVSPMRDMSSTGTMTSRSGSFALSRVDDVDLAAGATEERADRLERPLHVAESRSAAGRRPSGG